jgi:hypothetical protein
MRLIALIDGGTIAVIVETSTLAIAKPITRMFVTSTTLEWSSQTKESAGSDHFCRVHTERAGGSAVDLTSGKLVRCAHQVPRHSATWGSMASDLKVAGCNH